MTRTLTCALTLIRWVELEKFGVPVELTTKHYILVDGKRCARTGACMPSVAWSQTAP